MQELERLCRQLEETVEDLKQESMECSVMDEALKEEVERLRGHVHNLRQESADKARLSR